MSVKRQANSELNHDNWNDEDPEEAKEMGQFKAASKDELEKRVIRTAKRKITNASSEANKSVFSGFGGFNKAPQSSFDFLANLTNGSKNANGSNTSSAETPSAPGLFTSKPAAPSSGLFGVPTSTTSLSSQSSTFTSPFGTVKTSPSTLFTATKVDPPKETPFKMQPVSSLPQIDSTKSTTLTTHSVFGVSSTSINDNKPLFPSTNSTPFKIQPASSTNTAMVQTSFGISARPAPTSVTPIKKSDDNEKSNDKKIKYFSKLKGLNESVSDWISKHVVQTPLCILSPIFKDYEKYLKEITDEYQSGDKELNNLGAEAPAKVITSSPFAINNTGPSPFASASPSKIGTSNQDAKKSSPFGLANSSPSPLTSQTTKTSSPFAMNNTVSSPFTTPNTKTSTPFGINDKGPSPVSNQDAKTTTPFAINNLGFSPLNSQDTKTSINFGINNKGSSPVNNQDTSKASTPFAINNTGASPLNSQDTKPATPFGINNSGLSSLKSQDTIKSPFGNTNNDSSPFNSSPSSSTVKSSLFGAQNNLSSSPENKQQTFSFGIKSSTTNTSSTSTSSTGFSFVVTPSGKGATSSPFSQPPNTSTNQTSSAPFSFGIGKPFSFSPSTVQQPSTESTVPENEEDQPPKVEYTPVKEDNSVYEKKCKIFVKKDGNFADKGVGTLYIKKIEGNVKHQLLVRANTNLGTVLLNLVLAEAIPTQRMGKNNVMLVCIPTPDAKPPPTTVLIRVKTGEEADELLETLNKHKA